jgi:hypothetical protein
MPRRKQKWSDLPAVAKRLVIGASVVHVCLIGAAHTDLTRRPAAQIRGPKWLWRVLTAANSSFSVAYFVLGRHKPVT